MRHFFIGIIILSSLTALDEPLKDKANGVQAMVQICATCHQQDGNSVVPQWPKLAGQHANYLKLQLHAFKAGESGPRYNAVMYPYAMNLTDENINELALYFSSQKNLEQEAFNQENLKIGQQIYNRGIFEKNLMACSSCHGPKGTGNMPGLVPHISSQHKDYTANSLKEYRDGARKHYMMSLIAKKMSDDDIDAVSNYIQGLR